MTETLIGFLYNCASNINQNNESLTVLKSYYLMRCKEGTGGFGLPKKYFALKTRCPHCCMEWARDTEVMLRPLKLSKRQRQRIQSRKKFKDNKKALLKSNVMEKICKFCKKGTIIKLKKPERVPAKTRKDGCKTVKVSHKVTNTTTKLNLTQEKLKINVTKAKLKQKTPINVYSNAFDVFSLKNDKNTLLNSDKEPVKIIKNNKKKRDKFAGLCQKAVLAAAKLKQEKEKNNKLNLFLKPSVG